MGKKRRLNSAKGKFAAKHAGHPRMQILRAEEEVPVVAPIPVAAPIAPPVIAAPITEIIEEEEIVIPKVTTRPPRVKKTTTPSRKKTSTKTRKSAKV